MNSKKHIYSRRIRRAAILIAFLLMLIFSYYYNSSGNIEQVDIVVTNPEYGFVDEQSVLRFLQKEGYMKNGVIDKANIPNLEKALRKNNYIDSAEVFVTKKEHLNIVVAQMEPIARVFLNKNAQSFYLKSQNKLIPVSRDYTARVPIVTGFQHVVKDSIFRMHFADMMTYIARDSFWSAQIQQADISRHHEVTLYPLVGDHKILIGNVIDFSSKLDKLLEFYNQVLNKKGFDTYQMIDLRFDHQVVASPTLNNIDPSQKNEKI